MNEAKNNEREKGGGTEEGGGGGVFFGEGRGEDPPPVNANHARAYQTVRGPSAPRTATLLMTT